MELEREINLKDINLRLGQEVYTCPDRIDKLSTIQKWIIIKLEVDDVGTSDVEIDTSKIKIKMYNKDYAPNKNIVDIETNTSFHCDVTMYYIFVYKGEFYRLYLNRFDPIYDKTDKLRHVVEEYSNMLKEYENEKEKYYKLKAGETI